MLVVHLVETLERGEGGIELLESKHRWGEYEGVGPTLVAVIHHIDVSATDETAAHRLQLAVTHQPPRKAVIDAVF